MVFAFAVSAVAQTTTFTVDSPASNQTYSGTQVFGGWAVDSGSLIANIVIQLDGVDIAQAGYGGTRTDVCQVYVNYPGCPNIGWSWALDTSQITNGWHWLRAEATTADGRVTMNDVDFYTNNSSSSNVNIDSPVYGQTYSGTQVFGGWVVDTAATTAGVKIFVDGVFFTNAAIGTTRGDVCAAYPGTPGCPNVGWDYAIDTTSLANGAHTFSATAQTADGRVTRATIYNILINNSTGIFATSDHPQIQSHGDAPFATLYGNDAASGWSISTAANLSSVNIAIDGIAIGNASIVSRPDVCNAYPGRPGCPNVGWSTGADVNGFSDGLHWMSVTSNFSDSSHVTLCTPFLVQNSASPYSEYDSGNGGGGSATCNTPDKNLSSAAMVRKPGSDSRIHIAVDDHTGVGAPLTTALQMWNSKAGSTLTAFDVVAGSPSYDVKVQYDTSSNQQKSGGGCAAYDPIYRVIYYGNKALASTPNNFSAVLAHEIGHYLGLFDVTSFPTSPTIMNQIPPGGNCNFQSGQTTTVQATDASQVTNCRETTRLYAQNLAKAQENRHPQPPITVTVSSSPSYAPYSGGNYTCTFTYEIVDFYVDHMYDSSETFIKTVDCH